MFQIGEKILLTLWVGGMWTIGYVAAPILFKTLDDRMLAGNLAGQMFTVMSYIGLICGTFLVISQFTQSPAMNNWRLWTLLGMVLIVIIGQFVLQPMMAELKAAGLEGETARQFGKLHGVASIFFLINSIAGLALVITGLSSGK